MTFFLNSITDSPHPEERATGARLEGRTTTAAAVVSRVLVLLVVVLALAGCGKKGAPQPPPDEPNTFPRTYPSA
jgi:predicted small lipoprotein YifL